MTKSITITYDEADEHLLIAFFKRLKIRIDKGLTAPAPTQAELEAKLHPKQREVWEGLKRAIYDVENGLSEGRSLDEFLNELEYEDTLAHRV